MDRRNIHIAMLPVPSNLMSIATVALLGLWGGEKRVKPIDLPAFPTAPWGR